MSRTRNQRRRDDFFDRILSIIMIILLLVLIVAIIRQCKDINALQEKFNASSVTVMRAEDYLPAQFDRSAYEAASQRYDIEQGYVIPEQKETAPEAATSEAADARDIAS